MRAQSVAIVLGACLLTLAGGFALKGQCLRPWSDLHQYSSLCYNDLQPLWGSRGVAERTFPYVNGDLDNGQLVGGAIEYPVLSGTFMWATGAFADNVNEYLVHSAFFLAPFGLLIAWLLGRMAGLRALLFAAAPAVVMYAFHNWDLLAVAAATGGFFLWWRGHPLWAAAAFGVGAALKMYPVLFVGPLVLEALHVRDLRRAAQIAAVAVGVVVAVNLPFALAGFDGWAATYEFHTQRGPNTDNIWALRNFGPIHLPALEPDALNLVTAAFTGALFVGALGYGWVRARSLARYPVLPVSAALLTAFLLFSKVHSPQYALWIMPFFALVRVPIVWWVAYSVADVLVYVGVFRFFYESCARNACLFFSEPNGWQQLMTTGVFLRAVVLVSLFVVFLLSRETPSRHGSSRAAA
ncbi:MAG: glycosyltransferase 87 family protein [Actinomycetota bacterium]